VVSPWSFFNYLQHLSPSWFLQSFDKQFRSFFCFVFLWYWDLNSRPHTC
jgi:hypothetical protein